MTRRLDKNGALILLGGLLGLSPAIGMAEPAPQEATASPATDPAPPATDSEGLAEIVVTAEKRSASLQRTPIAISAFDATVLEARQITNVQSLSALAPSLTTTVPVGSPAGVGIFIRGLGGQEPLLTLDNAVPIYVDGIVLGRSAGAAFDIASLERVEILRGPQGTLYGRNAVGGAVNLITRKPTADPAMSQMVTVGNYGLLRTNTSLNSGELGQSGIRLSLYYLHKQRNGVVNDVNASKKNDPGAANVDAIRVAAAFDQGGGLRANYAFDYSDAVYRPQAFQLTTVSPRLQAFFAGSVAAGGVPLVSSPSRLDSLDLNNSRDLIDKNWAHTLTLEVDLGPNTLLRSLTGYRKWREIVEGLENDGNGNLRGPTIGGGVRSFTLFAATNRKQQHQFSQELNLIGSIGSFEYVAGAFYFNEKAGETNPQTFLFISGANGLQLNSTLAYDHRSTSKALFAQATLPLAERLKVTGGIRYTRDRRELDQRLPTARSLGRSFEKVNWSATANYQATDRVLAFARVATGYKSGGFNARSAGNDAFDPETVTAYELGIKSDLLDRRLRVNASLFYNEQKDLQVQQTRAGTAGAQSITTNAGAADFKGVELEITALPVDGLTLYANGSYVDRNYKRFIVRDPATDRLVDIADRAKFNYTASTTLSGGAEYKPAAFSFGQASIRADYSYTSRRYFNVSEIGTPFFRQIASAPYGLLDLRAQIADVAIGGGKATFGVFGLNVLNEKYRASGIDFGSLGFAGNTYGDPMTWGVDAKISF